MLYKMAGVSKQGVHQHIQHQAYNFEIESQLKYVIHKIRIDHPTIMIRSLYYMIMPETMGRDRFERFCANEGLYSVKPKNYRRTTNSNGVKRFDNLILHIRATKTDQVWVSDITYYELNNRFYYLTFIMDSYSRYIKGYSASQSLRTLHTTIPALRKAVRGRKLSRGLILHSDGGGQYYSNEYLKITKKYGIVNSMAKEAYENPQAERINGVIKNNYLVHWEIKTYKQLQLSLDRAVSLYNLEKPHSSLNYSTPKQIEDKSNYICSEQKTEGDESLSGKITINGASSTSIAEQKTSGSDVLQEKDLDLKVET